MEGQPSPPEKQGTPWTLIVIGVLAIYAVLLVILNSSQVNISFVFFSARISKLVLILLVLGIGFVSGLLFDRWRARGKRGASGE